MRIAILGVGAMGCLFGMYLTRHAQVTLIGHWPEQIAALRSVPLQVIAPDGTIERVPLAATDEPHRLPPVDLALVLTKARGTQHAGRVIERLLKPDGLAITLQNGIGNREILEAALGPERVSQGVTMLGASMEGPGKLRLGGQGATYLATGPQAHELLGRFADMLTASRLDVHLSQDVSGLVWGKLAINAGINPLTALLRVPNGALLESDWANRLMRQAAIEAAEVASALGIQMPFEDAAEQVERVARITAVNHSSMLQDIVRGAETEIEVICGAISRHGKDLGIATPVNDTLYQLVKALEALNSMRYQ